MIDETIITKIWRIAFKIGKEKLNLTKTLYISCDYERTKKAGHILKIPGLGLFCDYRFIILDCRQINALHYFKDQRRWKSRLINCQFIPDLSGYLLYDLPQPPPLYTVYSVFTVYSIFDWWWWFSRIQCPRSKQVHRYSSEENKSAKSIFVQN